MPASFDNEANQTAGGIPFPNKSTPKASAGVQIPTKNGKNNGTAKDGGGGVMAAVTKSNAAKSSKKKNAAITSQAQSPETKPEAPIQNEDPVTSPVLNALSSTLQSQAQEAKSETHTQNEVPVTSPVLEALSSTSQGSSVATTEWAKNLPAFSSSPNTLISLGESPPTQPSSYEDRTTYSGWAAKERKPSPSAYNPSSSPPFNRRRPLSYQMDGTAPYSPEEHQSHLANYAARRSSMYPQQSQAARFGTYPPLPHQPQAHFYGAPDPNLILSPRTPGLIPGDKGFHCGFDSLPSGQDSNKTAESVVVTGYEGGLRINSVSKRGLSRVITLDGLRGGVYNAKILPWTTQQESSMQFPLIAVVVHGPVWTKSDRSSEEYGVPPESITAPTDESTRGSPRLATQSVQGEDDDLIEYYQTTVEVYSLSTKKWIATLLSTPRTHLPVPASSPLFTPPAPVGSLTIRADRGNIVVASGVTGEAWIFRQVEHGVSTIDFRCLGKVWTTVQHGLSVDAATPNAYTDGRQGGDASIRAPYKASIISVNGRWLAYCPSAASSQVSLRATVPGNTSTGRVPGLNSFAPPHVPAVNCLVDTPGGEGMLKQVLQAATQGIVELSGYVGKQGAQYWNNYWNKNAASSQGNSSTTYQTQQSVSSQFPPTHGLTGQANTANKDPGLISILDLDALAQQTSGSSIHPLATFPVPHGCSFLSLAPSGLALFTASSKGDVQFVWDLMRLHYSRSSLLKANPQTGSLQGPHVRQIAQFSRMTIARIVDVVWTSPHGERAAMVTEPGTVHVLDLPASAFTWPPPRRRVVSSTTEHLNPDTSTAARAAVGVASSAVSSLWTVARPLVGSRRRRSSAGMSGITAASVKSQAGHGTQALAAGISRSVGAATGKMNEMRKAASTKLHLPKSGNTPSPNCVRLFNGKYGDSIFVVGGGIFRIYTVKSRRADRPADKQKASRGAKYVEFRIPSLPDIKIAQDPLHDLTADDVLDITARDAEDNWKARQAPSRVTRPSGAETSIPQAEIESNAPYQPFHTDRRVSLHIYSPDKPALASPSVSVLLSPLPRTEASAPKAWAFGGAIKTLRLDVGPPQVVEDDYETPADHRALPSSAIERVLRIGDAEQEGETILVTTRRRKGVGHGHAHVGAEEQGGQGDEEGFFEDDCEVLDFASQRV
ncbi:WD40 YVTN repeat-like-containing domain protein [Rutstroemia sp. NJR-2017a WRK4]|nr:WD40 YVTN repeat-like-containing domain protein [Rutstroemia sp. NJR-2017a WRK4]